MPAVVGIDLGTQSCKAVVCDDRLAVLGAHQVALATELPGPGAAEQDPLAWEAAVEQAVAGALARARVDGRDVSALALAGQLDGCVPVDAAGRPLHRALIWQDRRAIAEAALADAARVHAIAGQVADASHMAAKIRWLADRGVRAAHYHQPVSYLVARLTGAAVLDPAHASTTMLFDLAAAAWSAELLAAFDVDPATLPQLAPSTALAGPLAAPLAGIRAGTPVAVGTGDDFATPLGAGIVAPGPVAVVLGTAEVVGAVAPAPVLDTPAARRARDPWAHLAEPMVETHAFPTGAFFIEHPGWLSGGALRWAARLLAVSGDAELDALAEQAPPGAAGLTFVPALAGAMTPVWRPEARGALHGLTAAHDRPHVARAVLEGLAFACRDVVERLAALGLPAGDIIALGGGANSRTYLQLRADALGRPHHAAARPDTCALGAAMIALVAAGLARDLAAAAALAPPPAASFVPARSLDEAYARYRACVAALV